MQLGKAVLSCKTHSANGLFNENRRVQSKKKEYLDDLIILLRFTINPPSKWEIRCLRVVIRIGRN